MESPSYHCAGDRAMRMRKLLALVKMVEFRAHVRPQVIDSFLNWGDHGKPKSGKIKGRCQPPLVEFNLVVCFLVVWIGASGIRARWWERSAHLSHLPNFHENR